MTIFLRLNTNDAGFITFEYATNRSSGYCPCLTTSDVVKQMQSLRRLHNNVIFKFTLDNPLLALEDYSL